MRDLSRGTGGGNLRVSLGAAKHEWRGPRAAKIVNGARVTAMALAVLVQVSARMASAQGTGLAATPPMGWNSWDSYGTTVREDQVKANADVMARDLARFGWTYIVVDIQWYQPNAEGHDYKAGAVLTMDAYGRLTPAVNKFPSAADGSGFKSLAAYVHGKGLKFGLHLMRGIPRQAVAAGLPIKGTTYRATDIADRDNGSRWNPDMWGVDMTKPGAQAYYDSVAELYASWDVDFIKVDDMGSHLYQPAEMKALRLALAKTGRPIVLSISPGPAPVSEAAYFQKFSDMWRISDDFWDDWKLLRRQFDYMREWQGAPGRNSTWPDADMLPLGRLRLTDKAGKGAPTKFTPDEQRTMMTLWSIFRSPLMFGGDLPSNDAATTALITNEEVIRVNQRSAGAREVLARDSIRVWRAEVPASADRYVAVFNLDDRSRNVALEWKEVGVSFAPAAVRDLWTHGDLGTVDSLRAALPAHGSALYRVSPR